MTFSNMTLENNKEEKVMKKIYCNVCGWEGAELPTTKKVCPNCGDTEELVFYKNYETQSKKCENCAHFYECDNMGLYVNCINNNQCNYESESDKEKGDFILYSTEISSIKENEEDEKITHVLIKQLGEFTKYSPKEIKKVIKDDMERRLDKVKKDKYYIPYGYQKDIDITDKAPDFHHQEFGYLQYKLKHNKEFVESNVEYIITEHISYNFKKKGE